jgi:hypothetical protein
MDEVVTQILSESLLETQDRGSSVKRDLVKR